MSWENYGSLWHVDHIVPIQYRGADGQKPDVETLISRLHFTNLQPMWSEENRRKGNRFVGKPPPFLPLSSPQRTTRLAEDRQQNSIDSPLFRITPNHAGGVRSMHSFAASAIVSKGGRFRSPEGLHWGMRVALHPWGVITGGPFGSGHTMGVFKHEIRNLCISFSCPPAIDEQLDGDTPPCQSSTKNPPLTYSSSVIEVRERMVGTERKGGVESAALISGSTSQEHSHQRSSKRAQCPHGRQRYYCKECGGKGICEHGRVRKDCTECWGSQICEHRRRRRQCKECGGSQICQHNRQRSNCRDCQKDNPAFVERIEQQRLKRKHSHVYRLAQSVRHSVWKHLQVFRQGRLPPEDKRSHEYLGCSFHDLKAHLEKDDFHGNPGMSWENYGRLWHVDHIVPIKYGVPRGGTVDIEVLVSRLHFSNLQPLPAEENLRKGNRLIGRPPKLHPPRHKEKNGGLRCCTVSGCNRSFVSERGLHLHIMNTHKLTLKKA
uniref:C2H2-type domain-containing protein n=1 Tax=Chromera velia CCMP2878 TaxID=1169474 RepID=A0A0G4IAN9_9ALVE|eukprot:Cvel_12600.t1-p1 / transcript=Cvel_12600.t1 / gene=Cvel_12600 / organism=Chromera_velia_CCMP2878 / gene_product=hypothetical protein / transcript_product=hypothetical protein / location=Cvel_scaffold831:42048-43514(+) / protein_length=489 / sequence_SO=supercontig / SO=protein_coding / is_pseudo=false